MNKLILALAAALITVGPAQTQESPCFKIQEVRVNKNSVISKRKVKKLTRKFRGVCADPDVINLILREITNNIMDRGFVTSRAFMPPQSISSGIVTVQVMEGRLESIAFDESSKNSLSLFDKTQTLSAFAGFRNRTLNLSDIEQGLAQMNQISSKNITMKVTPGTKEGYSSLLLTDHGGNSHVRIRTSADNSGQESTGLYNVRLNVERDDMLKMNDSWSVSYSQSLKDQESERRSQGVYMSLRVPLGYWSVSGSLAKSDYATLIPGTNERIRNSGNGLHQNYKLDRNLLRGKHQTLSVWTQMNLKNTESYIEDIRSDVGSRRLTVVKTGFSHGFTSFLGNMNTSIGYHRGLGVLGANKDSGPSTAFTPRAEFNKVDANISYLKPFRVMGQNLQFKSFLGGQYAFGPVYSSEQIVIGDAYSVRGYKEKSAFGDQGFYASNEFSLGLPGFITESWGLNTLIRKSEWFGGFDVGQVQHFGGKTANFGQGEAFLTGWATGLRFNGKILNAEATYAQSAHTEDFIGRSQEIYATLSVRLF